MSEAAVKIACIQMEPVVGKKDENVRRGLDLVQKAAAQGARLIVLPELCNSGYVFESREEAFALAEEIPHGPTCKAWMDVARRHGLHKLCLEVFAHNTAAIALYRKNGFVEEGRRVQQYRRASGELWDSIVMGLAL